MFELELSVRDYECDLQGIVNNANYQHYLEHARHQFLLTHGLDFAELTRRGILLIVTRIELDYKSPLRPGDSFLVTLQLERVSRIRFLFNQSILRIPAREPVLHAKVFTASMNEKGRPCYPKELDSLLEKSPIE